MLTYDLGKIPDSVLESLMKREDVDLSEATESAKKIVEAVRTRGDSAVREYAAPRKSGCRRTCSTLSRSARRG
jgi:histidinol dehydrogenase